MIYYSVLKSAPAKKRSAGAFAIISDVANAFLQDYQNQKNRDFQEHMLDRQQQYQNELNANSALVQRQSLERAGLNPNLMSGAPPYGSASVLGDSSSQQAPQVDPSVFNVIAQMQQNQPLIDAQVKNIEADTAKKNAETGVADAERVLKKAQTWNIEQLTPVQRDNIEKNTAEMVQHIDNMKVDQQLVNATIGKVLAETVGQELQNYLTQESTPLILQQYASNIALLNAQKDLTDAQTAAAYKSLQVMAAQINALNSQANYNNAQAKYVATAMVGLAIDNDVKKYRASFTSDYVHKELKMSDAQITQAENAAEQMRVNTEFAPLQAIAGAGASLGVAFGGVATGLNQGAQFLNQKPARPIGFGR